MGAAISGAHTLGSAKLHNSGYEGFWSDSKNNGIFNNNYYKSILAKGWGPDLKVNGNPEKNQWKRIDTVPEGEHREFMLDTDMCLAYDNNREHAKCMVENKRMHGKCKEMQSFGFKGNPVAAKSGNCCAWIRQQALINHGVLKNGDNYCG